ncbi:hydrolase 2, exosortase A system-associated [Acidovorax sp.]|uniref:hydrolase 2, exosortase A system-associated n=1 Tax=Acidovorax sp. TaxID=1872122 RepID=UPI002FA6F8A1
MSLVGRATLPQAFFLPTDTGLRFCLFHPPQGDARRGCVLYLHPFAEELNGTRRVVAQQARALAQAGYGVLQIDLLGCGDSEGDFADATWQAWLQDARLAHRWLQEHARGPLWLWGLRAGALLATALASELADPCHLLLWQPTLSGQQQLQQFLRLHTASQWLGTGNANGPPPAYLLDKDQSVDIAGYTLTPALAQGLAAARLQPSQRLPGRLVWLELSAQAEPMLTPASVQQLALWRDAGWAVSALALTGPLFWQTVAHDEAPALLQATLDMLHGAGTQVKTP